MIHNQFSQSSSRPHIPHHFKWPSSIFQVAGNVCHEIIRGSFHCKIRKSEGVIFSSLVQKILIESPEPEVRYIAPFSEAEPEPWTPSLSWIHCSWCSINLSDGRSSSQFTKQRNSAVVFTFGFDIVMRSHYFTKHTIDIIHKKRDLRIFCFPQTLEFTLMSIKFIKPQLIILAIKLLIHFSLSVIPSLLMLIY